MTSKTPPPRRPPGLETYRPSDERAGPPGRGGPQDYPQGRPPQGYGPPGHAPQGYSQQQGYPPQQGQPYPRPMPPRDPNYARPAYPAPREGSGLGSTLFYGGLGLIAMAAGAVAFALLALPADFVRDRAIAAVKERTGRDLVIAGPSSFTIYPSLGISLADVSLSGAPGFEGAKPLVSMKSLDVSVAFWPLIQREVRVSSLVLHEPVFHLEVDGSGRRSWDFASADERRNRTRLAQADAPVTDAGPTTGGESRAARQHLSDVKLEDVRVENGALTYHDQRTGSTSEISSINTKMALAALTEPLSADGSLAYKGKTVRFNGALTSLAEVLEARPAKLNMTLGTDVLDATFEGTAKLETLSTEGILSAKASSARALFAWLGSELPPSDGFGAVTAKGLWRASPDRYAFSTAEIVLDQTTARGDISLDTRGARPLVDANLTLTELDLNTYASKGARHAASPKATEKDGKAKSIEDLLQQAPAEPGPRVQGFTKREGWDEDAYNLAPLGALDANAKLSIGKLTVGAYHLDQSDLNVALKNRVMITTLNQVRLYEGTGTGTVTLDGTTEKEANLGATLTLEGISALPLLKDAVEIDKVTGKGRLTLALTGQGANERQIVETLAGRISFAFADGAILGVNVPEMMRNLSKGNLGGLNTAPTDKTDFSEMTSTWTVRAGIAENQDLKLVSPLLRVGGSGKVELPAREVDYLLKPKLVASLAGQGGAQDLSGIEVPVRVHGPWNKPKYTPDFAGVLKDPKAVETIKDIGKQFKGKKADEIVNDLMSKDESGKSKGKKLLEQFLNKPQ